MNVRDAIVARRRARIAAEGHALGVPVPAVREAPLLPFLRRPPLICEIKRRSPSRGAIDASLDPVELAGRYRDRGARSISVLTEEDHFAGTLADLIAVKRAFPDLAVLRKDFLIDEEDVRVSHRAGADAVLLIASVLTADELSRMHALAAELGMAALVELHDDDDFAKARETAPPLVGINARDLASFRVDLLTPVRLRHRVDWPHRAVFESGVFAREDALLVSGSGFDGLLVGEAAVRDPDAVAGILAGLEEGAREAGARWGFWSRLTARMRDDRPLVKLCGITNRADAELAVDLGADVLGFVFAPSPRRAEPALLEDLRELPVLKAAVVVTGGTLGAARTGGRAHGPLPPEVHELLRRGLVDAVQFHGEEQPDECAASGLPYYRALRVARETDLDEIRRYRCPRVLVDARAETGYGGTGRRIASDLVREAAARGPLWLAGGMNDRTVAEAVTAFRPELVDASSGLEAEPGRKDPVRLRRFFAEVSYG